MVSALMGQVWIRAPPSPSLSLLCVLGQVPISRPLSAFVGNGIVSEDGCGTVSGDGWTESPKEGFHIDLSSASPLTPRL